MNFGYLIINFIATLIIKIKKENMKKTITVIALIICMQFKSQTVNLVGAPSELCLGDSISISISFTPPSVPSSTVLSYFYNKTWATLKIDTILAINYQKFYHFAKSVPFGDTIYSFKIKIPSTIDAGMNQLNAPDSYRNINYKNCTVGIQAYQLDDNKSIIYYDMQGNIIDKRYNALIIEQIGNVRRKIYIAD